MRFLCKDCWIAHRPEDLLSSCALCRAKAEGVDKPEKLGKRFPGNAIEEAVAQGRVVCSIHPAEPLKLTCPDCRETMSIRANVNRDSVVAVVGDSSAGKTSFLWVMRERLRNDHANGISLKRGIGDTDAKLDEAMKKIFESGAPDATIYDPELKERNYAWELIDERGREPRKFESRILALHDAGGEMWLKLPEVDPVKNVKMYRFIQLIGGVIFIVGGERLAHAMRVTDQGGIATTAMRREEDREIAIAEALIDRMLARPLRLPLSLAVSKVDLFWKQTEWKLFENRETPAETIDESVRKLLTRGRRRALLRTLERGFDPVRCFAISSYGFAPRPGHPVDERMIHPSRIEEPMMAMLTSHSMTRNA